MDEKKSQITAIDEYIAQFPEDIGQVLSGIRGVIKEAVPQAVEKISYQMPAFDLNGTLVYFAAFRDHISLFPTSSGIEAFREKLSAYKTSKGTIQFPLDKPMPYDLIIEIVKYRAAENLKKKARKRNS